MGFERFIASRYLMSRRKQTIISVISLMSVLGVAIGVAALVVVMGVYNGFTSDIRDKILGQTRTLRCFRLIRRFLIPWTDRRTQPGRRKRAQRPGRSRLLLWHPYLQKFRLCPG